MHTYGDRSERDNEKRILTPATFTSKRPSDIADSWQYLVLFGTVSILKSQGSFEGTALLAGIFYLKSNGGSSAPNCQIVLTDLLTEQVFNFSLWLSGADDSNKMFWMQPSRKDQIDPSQI